MQNDLAWRALNLLVYSVECFAGSRIF